MRHVNEGCQRDLWQTVLADAVHLDVSYRALC